MSARTAPLYANLAALATGAVALAAVPGLLLGMDLDPRWARVIAFGGCALGAAAFAIRWPASPWHWALWVSAPLWLYFGLVAATLVTRGESAHAPIVDAFLSLLFSGLGASLGALARSRRQRTA